MKFSMSGGVVKRVAVTVLLAAVTPVWAVDSTESQPLLAPEECSVQFTQDDPRLYEFVETRRLVDFSAYAGKTIRSIEYITLPIFNEKDKHEDNWLYHTANWLHVRTKKSPLRQQMLVQESEPLDRERIRESERILRAAPYLYDAMILPGTVCGDSIDLLVVVRDVWTLQLTGSYSRAGGDTSTSIGIAEGNVLGSGHGIYLAYEADSQRSGVAGGFRTNHMWDGHTTLNLGHVENDDGHADTILLDRPFYSADTPWAAGGAYNTNNLNEEIKINDVTINDYDHHVEAAEIYGGLLGSLNANVAHRWRAGITSIRNTYASQEPEYTLPLPEDRTVVYPWLEFETVEFDYWTTSNLNQLFRNEDINLGTRIRVRLGVTSNGLGSTQEYWVSQLEWEKTSSFGSHHAWRNFAYAELYRDRDDGGFEHSFMGYTTTYDHFIDDFNRWHVQFQLDVGRNLDLEETFTAGGVVLRGFESATQRGDRFALFNLEHRHFFDIHPWHLFRLGSAIFFEAGKVWDSKDRLEQSDKVLYDVGIGLRLNSSKARPNNILQFNVATPLNERDTVDKVQISFYASETF